MTSGIANPTEYSIQELFAANPGHFHHYVEKVRTNKTLILQPRMGFGDVSMMRQGLQAVESLPANTIGTITLDSYTRTGQLELAASSLRCGHDLNGYPLVTLGDATTRELIEGIHKPDFPIQVRHGSPLPEEIFRTMISAGLDASEGGPVSYCLPYSRVPLRDAVEAWSRSCELLAALRELGTQPHLESFGGCVLGQLCPPELLLAVAVLEGVFFFRHGLRSISLSYAQGTHEDQDVGALIALRGLAEVFLPEASWHVVTYTFMGCFPQSREGSRRLIEDSVTTALAGGAERLITKTAAEAFQIPSIESNVEALMWASEAARRGTQRPPSAAALRHAEVILARAKTLVEHVLDLHTSIDQGIEIAFREGYLDIPYCLHEDNANRARSWIDAEGVIRWAECGKIPFPEGARPSSFQDLVDVGSEELRQMLFFNRNKYDRLAMASVNNNGGPPWNLALF